MHLLRVALFLSLTTATTLHAENWPQWRGAKFDGISTEKNLPSTWSKTENVAWKATLPGPGGSTPSIWDKHIFLTCVDGKDLVLIGIDTSGKELWKKVIGSGNQNVRGDEGNYASPSTSTDGKNVWAFVGNGVMACYDFAGKEIWKLDLQERYGKFNIQFGLSSTPVLDGDKLYMQLIHSGGAHVIAFDKNTGKEVWHTKRPSDATDECEQSYASPTLYRDGKLEYLLTHGADYIIAHNLTDGKELWRCGGLNPHGGRYNKTLRFVASPLAVPGLIVVPSAKNGPVMGLKPDSKGDISTDAFQHAWTMPQNTPDVPSPLVYDGFVYLCRENGNLICLDAKTGEKYYDNRTHADRHRASPIYADGKILITARDGTITVVKPGKEFSVIASNKLDEHMTASPAISDGTIYLRTFESLYAIRAAK